VASRTRYGWAGFFLVCVIATALAAPFQLTPQILSAVQDRYGSRGRSLLQDWVEVINENKDKSDEDKIEAANRFFNRNIYFVSDERHWHKKDYWATPLETIATRGGDCEDFSIGKYFTLREMGVPDSKLRITYVRARRLRQPHMVLSYYPTPGAVPLILDNLTDRILPATERRDLKPVYSFNGSSLWMAKARGSGAPVGNSSSIHLWAQVQKRMMLEGDQPPSGGN
jgi:predicted transglutaminase-like cysteine proteinase